MSRDVSAVVVSYFTGPLLSRALEALCAQPELRELILVDNGNWEGAVDAALAGIDLSDIDLTVMRGQGNVGFAVGCNLGARQAAGEFLLFINPDAVMPPGGLGRLLEDGRLQERPWLIAPKVVDPDGGEQQGSRRATLTPWRAFVELTRLYKLAPRHPYFRRFNLHSDPCPAEVTPLPVVSGACMLTPREDYFAIGGMDESYFLHAEDVDFCLRFAQDGGSILFDPHVSLLHYKSSSRVGPVQVEARKIASLDRYFRTHFRKVYPPFFLSIVTAGMWVAFAAKITLRPAAQFGRAIFGGRLGKVRRARDIAALRARR